MKIRTISERELRVIKSRRLSKNDVNTGLYGRISTFDISIERNTDESDNEPRLNPFIKDDKSDVKLNVIINYPLANAVLVTVKAKTFMELGYRICDAYKQIYREEEMMADSNEGKYGIWGHGIDDLVLEEVIISGNYVYLSVGS